MDGDTQVQKSPQDVGSVDTNSKSPRDAHSAGDYPAPSIVHSSSSCLALMTNDSPDFINCYPFILQNAETSSTPTDDDPSLSVDAEMPDFVQISPQSNNKNDLDSDYDDNEEDYSDDEDSVEKVAANEKRRTDSSDGVTLAQLQRSLSECHFSDCEKGKNLVREQTKPQSRSAHSIPAVSTSPARPNILHSQSAPLVHQCKETDSNCGAEEDSVSGHHQSLGFLKCNPNKSPSFPAEFVPRVHLMAPTYNLTTEEETKKETEKQPFFRSNMKTRRSCPQEEEENDPDLPLMSTILENMPWNSNKARDYLQNYLNLALSRADDYKVQKLKQQLKYLTIRNKKRSYRNMSRNNENGESFPDNNNRTSYEWGHKPAVPLPRRPLPPPPLPPPPPSVARLPKPGLDNWWRTGKVRNWEPFPGNMKRWEPTMPCLEPRIPMAPTEPGCFRPLHPPRWVAPFWSNCAIPSQWPPIRHCATPHYIRAGWCPPCPIRVAGGDILGARQDRKWIGPNMRKTKY